MNTRNATAEQILDAAERVRIGGYYAMSFRDLESFRRRGKERERPLSFSGQDRPRRGAGRALSRTPVREAPRRARKRRRRGKSSLRSSSSTATRSQGWRHLPVRHAGRGERRIARDRGARGARLLRGEYCRVRAVLEEGALSDAAQDDATLFVATLQGALIRRQPGRSQRFRPAARRILQPFRT